MEELNQTAVVLGIIVGISLLCAGTWDLWCAFYLTPKDTVSYAFWTLIVKFPPLVIMLGMILGHILWPLHVSDQVNKFQLPKQ